MGNRKQTTQVIIAFLSMAFLGGLYYLYTQMGRAGDSWPFFNEPGTLTNDITNLDGEIARLRTEISLIPAAQEQLDAITVEYELATRVLPSRISPDELMAAIQVKAQQAGVIPLSLVPAVIRGGQAQRGAAAAGGGNFEELSFTLSLRGNYDQIASFVNRMEEFEFSDSTRVGSERWFFKVTSIDIAAEDGGMSFLMPADVSEGSELRGHQCSLVMSTYRYSGN